MDTLKKWLILSIILVLVMGGFFYLRQVFFTGTDETSDLQENQDNHPQGFDDSPLGIQQKTEDEISLMNQALNSGNVSDCNKITNNETLRQQCQDNLNYAMILKSGDETKCDQLHSEILKTQCHDKIYLSVAVDEKNLELCNLISEAELRQMCIDQVQRILSRYAEDTEECSTISSKVLKEECENNVYAKIGLKTLNPQECNRISDSRLSDQCKTKINKNLEVIEQSKQAAQNATVTRTFEEILELCNSLSGPSAANCQDAVYPQMAFDKKDLSYCDKISDQSKQGECRREQGDKLNEYYLREALASKDKTLCSQISDGELRELCQST